MIYFVCFGVSTLFAYLASKTKNRPVFLLLSLMSILVTATLAGLRDYTIGVDTEHYLTYSQFWGGAVKYDTLREYMAYYQSRDLGEPLFALILGLIEHYTGNFSLFLFVEHLVIITGIYIGAIRQREHVSPALILMLFYLCFYNHSLNGTRQYMAMAVIFAALADIQKRNYLRFIIAVLIARFIHVSALLALGALLIHWVQDCRFVRLAPSFAPSGRARRTFVLAGLSVLVLVFPWLCQQLIHMGVLGKKYLFYLNPDKAEYSLLITLFLLVEMAALFLLRRPMKNNLVHYNYYMVSSVSYLILQQLSAVLRYGKRIAAYYALANLVTIAMIPRAYKRRENRIVATLLVVAVAFVYWWYVYILRQGSETYPYVFAFTNG